MQRRGTRAALRWNIAADIVVNGIIMAQNDFALPPGHIGYQKLDHLSVEEIYHLLTSYPAIKLANPDLLEPLNELLPADEYHELEVHWRQALQQAQTVLDVLGRGADFWPFFTSIEEKNPPVTDGYDTFPSEPPSLPVLWILSVGGWDTKNIPFGEAVRLIPDVK